MKKSVISLLVLLFTIFTGFAQDWPQFLGPERNSTSPQTGILRSWPETGPQILWTTHVGIGYGGPVVKDGKVYLLDRVDSIGDNMRCFELASGKELWNCMIASPGTFPFPGSRSVPAADQNFVYGCGAIGDLFCVDINTHKLVWQKNIWTSYGGDELPIWAISQCPLIYGDLLIVSSHAPKAGVVAYHKRTGEVVWSTPNLGNETYVSPSLAKISDEDHVVMVTSSTNPFRNQGAEKTSGKVIGIEPLTGKILWEYNNWDCHISVASPLDAGENKLLVVGGYELGCAMIRVDKNPDGSFSVTELFKHNEFGDQTKPPVYIGGHFYAQFETNRTRDGLVCMDGEGRVKWKTKRDPDFNKGSMILADGLLLATDGSNTLYLIEPDTTAYKQLASFEIMKQGGVDTSNNMTNFGGPTQNWAPIALADGKLLIRDQSRMMCLIVAE